MGIYYDYKKDEFKNDINEDNLEKTAPEFYLNKKFPNHNNLSIEDVIQKFLKSKYDLLENKQLTTSLSKEFNLLLSANNKQTNSTNEKANNSGIEDKIKKNLFCNQKKNNKTNSEFNNSNQHDINIFTDNIFLEKLNESCKNNEKENLKKKINFNNLDSSSIGESNNNNTKKKKLFFLSDYNIYSCNDNTAEMGDNPNSEDKKINVINREPINNNPNSKVEDKQKKCEIKIGSNNQNEKLKKEIKNEIKNEIKKEEKKVKKEKVKEKKEKVKEKERPLSDKKVMNEKEIEPILKAGSLMKDIRKEYKFKSSLGGGHFGTVRKAYKKSEKEEIKYYAIKSIPMKNLSSNIDDFIKEVDIISTLDHPNIIKFYETYHDKCFFHIVMELCRGKEILRQMNNDGHMDEQKVVKIIVKVLLATAHCHNRGITHRDLKPENILFDSTKEDAEIKLIDFGLSRKYDKEQKMHSILGTPYYVAPEVLKGEYDEKCDIWSIGAVTYLLLCGEPPFTGNSNNEIFKKIVNDNVKFNFYKWKNISNNAKDFVRICLNKNASKRPSASEALKYPWFNNVLKETHNINNIKKEIMINIKNFNINYEFKKMVLKYLINNLTDEEKKIYKEAFYAVDFNHNGFILPQELKHTYDLMNIDITIEQINYLFNILPQNKNLGMGYSEFIMAGVDQKKLFTEENLEDSFKYFDINKTGFIEYDNLNSALLRMGKKYVYSDDIISIINDVAKIINKDIKNEEKYNKISKEDFMKIFLEK